ncbi:MAG TPA: hypothetical protein VM076_14510 [Gemmatimonadaceae bacterium]|nr:hypothetical protein [Gemmatimonadaceae bacterium]
MTMPIDPENPVAKLCAAGMEVEGDSAAASALFAQAWEARRDDYDAAIAAHFVARHQPTPEETLRWNALALEHGLRVGDDRLAELLPSLYLNVADSQRLVGNDAEASRVVALASAAVEGLPAGGYRDFVSFGIERLKDRLSGAARLP